MVVVAMNHNGVMTRAMVAVRHATVPMVGRVLHSVVRAMAVMGARRGSFGRQGQCGDCRERQGDEFQGDFSRFRRPTNSYSDTGRAKRPDKCRIRRAVPPVTEA